MSTRPLPLPVFVGGEEAVDGGLGLGVLGRGVVVVVGRVGRLGLGVVLVGVAGAVVSFPLTGRIWML